MTPQLSLIGFEHFQVDKDIFDNDWDGFLFAVPKKRISKQRKKKRNRLNVIKPIENTTMCFKCRNLMLTHHLCPFCHPFIKWIGGRDRSILKNKTIDKSKADLSPLDCLEEDRYK